MIPRSRLRLIIGLTLLGLAGCAPAGSESPALALPRVTVGVEAARTPQDLSVSLQVLLLLTVLTLAPSLLIMLTAFTRIVIVLSLVRNAIGVPQLPPNQVIIGLALFLTFFVMAPTWNAIHREALQPYLAGEISQIEAFRRAEQPIRQFMLRQTREKDLALFVHLARLDPPRTADDIPTYVLIPAFIISELKTAFQMGFLLFLPFLIIDIVVSSVLMSMGMLMLPPVVISLPFKLLLFVLVDGWHLIARSLVQSFL